VTSIVAEEQATLDIHTHNPDTLTRIRILSTFVILSNIVCSINISTQYSLISQPKSTYHQMKAQIMIIEED